MAGRSGEDVVRCSRDAYGETFTADLLEQYKLYVQSAEHVSARRLASSRLLLALNAGLAALYGIRPEGFGQSWWAVTVPLLGIAVSLLWSRIIRSHKELNRVKFELIHELERHLPAAPYLRMAAGRAGPGPVVSRRDRYRAMAPVDVPRPACRPSDCIGRRSGSGAAGAPGTIAAIPGARRFAGAPIRPLWPGLRRDVDAHAPRLAQVLGGAPCPQLQPQHRER